jgi:hypothetical protein
MNERLKELLLQAALEALKEEPTDYIACDLLKVEKFAESIIRECHNIAYDGDGILEHFGVKNEI